MLRELHPDRQAANYVLVPLWTLYPDANPVRPPIPRVPLPDYSSLNEPATVHVDRTPVRDFTALVAAALTEQPQTIDALSGAVGLRYFVVRRWLNWLVQQRRAVRTWQRPIGRLLRRQRAKRIAVYARAR